MWAFGGRSSKAFITLFRLTMLVPYLSASSTLYGGSANTKSYIPSGTVLSD